MTFLDHLIRGIFAMVVIAVIFGGAYIVVASIVDALNDRTNPPVSPSLVELEEEYDYVRVVYS